MNRKVNMAILLLGCMLLAGCKKQEELFVLSSQTSVPVMEVSTEAALPRQIAVYVCGQVANPGVVYLEEGARAVDAVEAAGGFADSADKEYVNLAALVQDGEKLYIPDKVESEQLQRQEQQLFAEYVNINTADAERLMTLPGIGESKAQDIIAYRQEHGDFTVKEDLMKISGIKENLFNKIKDKIVLK